MSMDLIENLSQVVVFFLPGLFSSVHQTLQTLKKR